MIGIVDEQFGTYTVIRLRSVSALWSNLSGDVSLRPTLGYCFDFGSLLLT
jgi:hypothetical protein